MWNLGMPEMIIIALALILLFGAKRLPEIGSSIGKAIREFKKAGREIKDDVAATIEDKGDEKKS